MSNADLWPDGEPVWYRIDLDQVAELIEDYESRLWKHSPWYRQVNWLRVAHGLDDIVQQHCRNGLVDGDLPALLTPLERTLDRTEQEGLDALLHWPLCISRLQLYDGGHRAVAMLSQGVGYVPGQCIRADVGSSISAGQVYPVEGLSPGVRT